MTSWTGQAQLLADDIREPGFTAAAVNASAWRARVDPDATHGLVGAALALTAGDAGGALWASADPCPDDRTLLAAAAELEGAVTELLGYARRIAGDCRAALEAAVARAAAAAAALASAQAAGDSGAAAMAEGAQSEAQAEIADCQAALEVLGSTGDRLAHALNCLRRVPDDVAGTYEPAYGLVYEGGCLPFDGDFLTGGIITIGAS